MISTSGKLGRRRGGFALIVVMWVVVVAGLMLLGVHRAVRVNQAMSYNELASLQAHWLARAGVERAMAALEDDDTDVDGTLDNWYADSEAFERAELVGGTFSVTAPPGESADPRAGRFGLVDHCAMVNLNTADQKQLKSLCELEDWQVNSILDWRDADAKTRSGGAEGMYYHHLEHPYLIRNGPLETVGELRLVRGIDSLAFRGEDANGNGVLDENEEDLGESFPADDGDGELTLGMGGLCTIYSYELNRDANGDKRVNVNTADTKTLVDTFNFTDALAKAVTEYGANTTSGKSPTAKEPGKDQKKRFTSLMDMLKVKARQTQESKDADQEKVDKIDVKWLANHLDELTLTDDDRLAGRINVNTAPGEVLMTLGGMDPSTAHKILQHGGIGSGSFSSVGELLTGGTITEDQFKKFAERLTVRSSVFEIRSSAVTTWGVRREIVAVVDRGTQPMTVLYWCQSE